MHILCTLFKDLFIYLFRLCWIFVAVCGLSLAVSRGCSLAVVYGLLTAVASLVVEHTASRVCRLSRCGTQG